MFVRQWFSNFSASASPGRLIKIQIAETLPPDKDFLNQ